MWLTRQLVVIIAAMVIVAPLRHGEWYGGRHLRMTWALAVGQLAVARPELMPNTVPSSAAPNSTIRPASIVKATACASGFSPFRFSEMN